MYEFFTTHASNKIIPIVPICIKDWDVWYRGQPERIKNFVLINKFTARSSSYCFVLNRNGHIEKVFLSLDDKDDFYSFGVLPKVLPRGVYEIVTENLSMEQVERTIIGYGIGNYQFKKYKKTIALEAKLFIPKNVNFSKINSILEAIYLVRDLINMPADDLYPEKLATIATNIASDFKAKITIIKGRELAINFPAIYAVGRASSHKPLLIDLQYGKFNAPKVVLVGKGVCFDSGGLQLKTPSGMFLMKKDMAGAAHALGLARLIMAAKLSINLRVIIPVVENLISGDVLKPGDIIKTRKGITMEVVNTDAEGRLILADALAYASEWQPELILDFATLTGASRVALGPDITALFTNNDNLAEDIINNMLNEQEPIWRLPIYEPYLEFLKSKIADFKNIATSNYVNGGAIIATLILQQFVDPKIRWAHFDMNAYNEIFRPGRPEGGEAMCLRGLFRYFEFLFG
ncbi:MAG: leucyl aminopeptidase family protein [Coxiellaceae bacterium]|jgi:leucyl aminopeptidase|nr:leucyl aminopeptidase family protein [Coxiellaceae bacterium]